MKKLLVLLGLLCTLQAGTVRLINDSVFQLQAEIRGADGSSLATVSLNSQQAMTWDDYAGGRGTYSQSRTPYTVIWYCPSGNVFGVASQISSGAATSALSSSGDRACQETKEKPGNPSKGKKGNTQNSLSPGDTLLNQDEQQEERAAGPPEGLLD